MRRRYAKNHGFGDRRRHGPHNAVTQANRFNRMFPPPVFVMRHNRYAPMTRQQTLMGEHTQRCVVPCSRAGGATSTSFRRHAAPELTPRRGTGRQHPPQTEFPAPEGRCGCGPVSHCASQGTHRQDTWEGIPHDPKRARDGWATHDPTEQRQGEPWTKRASQDPRVAPCLLVPITTLSVERLALGQVPRTDLSLVRRTSGMELFSAHPMEGAVSSRWHH